MLSSHNIKKANLPEPIRLVRKNQDSSAAIFAACCKLPVWTDVSRVLCDCNLKIDCARLIAKLFVAASWFCVRLFL